MNAKNAKDNSQIKELRDTMFNQLKRLNDPGVDLDKEIKRASALTQVGTVIVNSVKAEIDFMRLTKLPGKPTPKQLGNGK
jgi:hypothetical protein